MRKICREVYGTSLIHVFVCKNTAQPLLNDAGTHFNHVALGNTGPLPCVGLPATRPSDFNFPSVLWSLTHVETAEEGVASLQVR